MIGVLLQVVGGVTILIFGILGVLNLFLWATEAKRVVHRSGGVLISGTSSGIGRKIALRVAKEGYTVFAGVRRKRDAERLLDECPEGNIRPVIMDVTKPETIESTLEEIQQSGIKLVGVVNNAGIANYSILEGLDVDKDIRSMFEVNVIGMFALAKATLPILRENKGRMLIVSSIAAMQTLAGFSAYSASKVAVEPLAEGIRLEAGSDVSVSIIRPGFVKTDILHSIDQLLSGDGGTGDENIRELRAKYPDVYNRTNDMAWQLGMELADHPKSTVQAAMHGLTNAFPKFEYFTSNTFGIPVGLVALTNMFPPRVKGAIQTIALPLVGHNPEVFRQLVKSIRGEK